LLGLGVACRWARPSRVLCRGQQVRRRAAPRRGYRARRRTTRACAGARGDHVRRPGSDARLDRDDCDRRRVQGLTDASRVPAREAWRAGRRARADRRGGSIRQARVRPAIRLSRRSGRERRHVCRSTVLASAAGCHQPSPGARGAARPRSSAHIAAAPGCGGSTRRCATSGFVRCSPSSTRPRGALRSGSHPRFCSSRTAGHGVCGDRRQRARKRPWHRRRHAGHRSGAKPQHSGHGACARAYRAFLTPDEGAGSRSCVESDGGEARAWRRSEQRSSSASRGAARSAGEGRERRKGPRFGRGTSA
jgi:hypothetical protein